MDWQTAVTEFFRFLDSAGLWLQVLAGIGLTAIGGLGTWNVSRGVLRAGLWTGSRAVAWLRKPSRVARLEDQFTALLVKLGEQPQRKTA